MAELPIEKFRNWLLVQSVWSTAPFFEELHPLCHDETGVSHSGSGIQCNCHLCHVSIQFKMRLHYTLWPNNT